MDSEELKSLWSDYDKKLEQNLKLNLEMLKKMNLDRASGEMKKPMFAELFNIIGTFIFASYLISLSVLLIDQYKYSIPGIICTISVLTIMVFSLIRITRLRNMDYFDGSILQLQKQIYNFQILRSRLGRIELLATITAIVTMWPIVIITGFEIDVYSNIMVILLALVTTVAIAAPIGVWHERAYRRKIKKTQQLFEEIQELESEG